MIPYCNCPQCTEEDLPEEQIDQDELSKMRAEVVQAPDFIGEIAPNPDESAAISAAIIAGDDAAIGAIVRSVLSRLLDEHVASYRSRSGAGVQQAMGHLHKLYVDVEAKR
jgi:hypothetical protein